MVLRRAESPWGTWRGQGLGRDDLANGRVMFPAGGYASGWWSWWIGLQQRASIWSAPPRLAEQFYWWSSRLSRPCQLNEESIALGRDNTLMLWHLNLEVSLYRPLNGEGCPIPFNAIIVTPCYPYSPCHSYQPMPLILAYAIHTSPYHSYQPMPPMSAPAYCWRSNQFDSV